MANHDNPPEDGKKKRPLSTNGSTIRLKTTELHHYFPCHAARGSLLVIAGTPADIGTHVVVEESVIIGRDPHGLQLHDSGISRNHAIAICREQQYFLRDLGSTNGTSVNGMALSSEWTLCEGDKIMLGHTVIKFRLVDETEAMFLKQVEHLVATDDLTGLMSKHRFDSVLKETLRTVQLAGEPLVVMMMDLDGLKAINDRHGHQAGAETIRQVGNMIGHIFTGRGEACRFGGDEFSAFAQGIGIKEGFKLASEICRKVEKLRIFWHKTRLPITISIGIAERVTPGVDIGTLIHSADEALYRAKAKGKNTVSD